VPLKQYHCGGNRVDKARQECGLGKRKQKVQKQRNHLNKHGGMGGNWKSTPSWARGGRKEESGTFWKTKAKM